MLKRMSKDQREKYNITYFKNWSYKYDNFRISNWFRYTQDLSLSLLNFNKNNKFLDVGCGTGYAVALTASYLSNGLSCGIDISPEMIERAKNNIQSDRGNIEFKVASAEEIPYDNNTFDYVLCTNSFHHYHRPIKSLKEMYRVLCPKGTLIIFENAPDLSLYTKIWDIWLRIYENGHVRYYSSQELGEMIINANYKNVQLRVLKNEFLKFKKLYASIQIWSAEKY
ncbi:MAG: methyltransferase domain-containing protein [Candidatus Marinimicrobia bacterium]|nr:methyltransferase domain-containing protein [Candidatus Neomarinimicrobiota bacterium]